MWTCETKVGITCLVVICGSANTVAFAAAILQWEEMVVSLSYGVVFFGASIFFLMLLFAILASDNQKGMTLMTHACKTRPVFLLIFLGLFNAELRGLIQFKYVRSTAVTSMPMTMPPPGPVLAQWHKLLASHNGADQRHDDRHAGLHGPPLLRQMNDEDAQPEEATLKLDPDIVMYLSCGLFICNVILDCFVVRRLSLYTAKMSLPVLVSGSAPSQPSASKTHE
ncbi:uncharacterized protein LOC119159638 [Rhipicephalus microplus]|uniref:uncharacterized protein LOC119159638 n=1 Tax=Rhipicephalus microplus TaxID=6941 RepID=UPI003F6A59B2